MRLGLFVLFVSICVVAGRSEVKAQDKVGRSYQHAQSPVKNQGGQGTCMAFAVAGALETFPGVPADLSEQYLFHRAKMFSKDGGDHPVETLANYVPALKTFGVVHETVLPYRPLHLDWKKEDPALTQLDQDGQTLSAPGIEAPYAKYKLNEGDYLLLAGEEAQNTQNIRDLFDQGVKAVVVVYHIHKGNWKKPTSGVIQLDDAIQFTYEDKPVTSAFLNGLSEADPAKIEGLLRDTLIEHYTPHALTLTGYDDYGFQFKNSWGTDWGRDGFGHLSYDFHQVFALEALSIRTLTFVKPAENPEAATDYEFQLKTTPILRNGRKALNFSLFTTHQYNEPQIVWVKYRVYAHAMFGADEPTLLATETVLSPVKGRHDNSSQAVLLGNHDFQVSSFLKTLSVRVTIQPMSTSVATDLLFNNIQWQCREYLPAKPPQRP